MNLEYYLEYFFFSADRQTCKHQILQILSQLLANQLYIKGEKCECHTGTANCVGIVISTNQVQMDPEKICAITNWLTLQENG